MSYKLLVILPLSLVLINCTSTQKSDRNNSDSQLRQAASVDKQMISRIVSELRPKLTESIQEARDCDLVTSSGVQFIDAIMEKGMLEGANELASDMLASAGGSIDAHGSDEYDAKLRLESIRKQTEAKNLTTCNSKAKVYKNCVLGQPKDYSVEPAYIRHVSADFQVVRLESKITKAFRGTPAYKKIKDSKQKRNELLKQFGEVCKEKARSASIANVTAKCKAGFLSGFPARNSSEECVFRGDKTQLTIFPEPQVVGINSDEIECGTTGSGDQRKELKKIPRIIVAQIDRPEGLRFLASVKQSAKNHITQEAVVQNSSRIMNSLNSNNIQSNFLSLSYMLPAELRTKCSDLSQKKIYEFSRATSQVFLYHDLSIKVPVQLLVPNVFANSVEEAKNKALPIMTNALARGVDECNLKATGILRNCLPMIPAAGDTMGHKLSAGYIECTEDQQSTATSNKAYRCSAGEVIVANQILGMTL